MAKKPKSQQRKGAKNKSLGGDAVDPENFEFLSEEHTIADSIATDFSSQFDEAADITDYDDTATDDLIAHSGDHRDNANASAASRLFRLQDALMGLDEYATESRSAKRQAVLKRLFQALTHFATGSSGADAVMASSDDIRQACWYAIRVGPPAEQYAACRVLEATSVIMGADQDEWCESLQKTCRRLVLASHRSVPVRMAGLRALTMAVFVGSSDTLTSESLMDFCEQVIMGGGTTGSHEQSSSSSSSGQQQQQQQPDQLGSPQSSSTAAAAAAAATTTTTTSTATPTALRATGLDCWSLLATTVDDLYLAGQDDVQMGRGLAILQMLSDCLDDNNNNNNMDLRSAAGECLALVHEARLNLGWSEYDNAGVGPNNVTARQFERGSWEGSPQEELVAVIQQRIADLAVQSGHYMHKKAKKQQRAAFREYAATIVDNEAPEEVVNFRNGSLTLTTWREIVQLKFVRHCLQGGFQIQLMTNATLQAIFGANGQALNDIVGLSQIEKRLILSKTSEASKVADQKMSKNRTKRQNIKNHFLTADGEDI